MAVESKPSVTYQEEYPRHTTMVLRDCPTVWVWHSRHVSLGYDMETNELLAVQVYGTRDLRTRNPQRGEH
jgi:hypothetical protein